MNITLISLYSIFTPIGLRSLSSSLRVAGHKVSIIFIPREADFNLKNAFRFRFLPDKINMEYEEKTRNTLFELLKNSDLIGISLSSNFFEDAIQITKIFKKEFKIPIVWGGIHPTINPEECLEYADIVCRGEGEEAMVELADKIEKKEDYHNVKNICFKNDRGDIIINPVRSLIQDLDSIPFQDFDFENKYAIAKGKIYKIDEKIILNKDLWPFNKEDILAYRTMFTRGCLFGCTYCCNNFLNNLYSGQKIFRKRSVDNVIKELKIVKNSMSFIRFVMFADDNFLSLSLEEIKEFSEKYKKDINLPFGLAGVHPITVDREKFKYLVYAGLSVIRMGIQSANEKSKKLYKRDYPNSQVLKACQIINEFKDKIIIKHYDVILDNPWETEEDLIETLILLSRIPVPCEFVLFFLTFFPGTELYNLAEKDGFIKDKVENLYQKNYWKYSLKSMSYLNRLFVILRDSASLGERIPPRVMFLLTDKIFRKLGLNLFLYYFIFFKIKFLRLYKKKIMDF